MHFKIFADTINKKFLELSSSGTLLRVNASKEELWRTYQGAFPLAHNSIFRERRVHECNTCYSFIKRLGSVVGVTNGEIDTIWNVSGLSEPYQSVANAMHEFVIKHSISSAFLTDENIAGKEYNIEESQAGNIRWDHFYADINSVFVSQSVAADSGEISSVVEVFNRALNEFSLEALELVEELLDDIYRGIEFKPAVTSFIRAKKAYEESTNKDIFIWTEYKNYPAKIRNTAVGTFIIDINKGDDTVDAVNKFAKMLDPANYKRCTTVATSKQREQAKLKIDELGLRDSIPRRHSVLNDISVNDMLFSDVDAQSVMKDALDILLTKSVEIDSAPKSVSEVNIDEFISNILPNSTKVELLLENRHIPNFVSLVAPVNADAPNMLKWNNNFSWSYAGEVTDSIKQRVKDAGGCTDGKLGFRLQWNECGSDGNNDLDAHCKSPVSHIYYGNDKGRCGGVLDVDVRNPANETKDGVAVENITWENLVDGTYSFWVNNYNGRNTGGFRAQIEILGETFEYSYDKSVQTDVKVATLEIRNGVLYKIIHNNNITTSNVQKTQWDVTTKTYQKVSTIMLSPNFWDNQKIGNKHYFFMLDGCVNPDPVRGFYNEFLMDSLISERKTFEMISSAMKCEPTHDQLSGLGFSSTLRNDVYVKVDNRPYKILF